MAWKSPQCSQSTRLIALLTDPGLLDLRAQGNVIYYDIESHTHTHVCLVVHSETLHGSQTIVLYNVLGALPWGKGTLG